MFPLGLDSTAQSKLHHDRQYLDCSLSVGHYIVKTRQANSNEQLTIASNFLKTFRTMTSPMTTVLTPRKTKASLMTH